MKKLSQTALYGELLNGEEQYRSDVAKLPRYTEEERQSLLDRARHGV